MTSFPMEIGRVVYSRAGRDAGSHYVVVGMIDDAYVAIANGCLRKVSNPKKKKIKHLTARPACIQDIAEKLRGLGADIRRIEQPDRPMRRAQ